MFFHGDTTEIMYADSNVKNAKTYVANIGIVGGALILYWHNYSCWMANLTPKQDMP